MWTITTWCRTITGFATTAVAFALVGIATVGTRLAWFVAAIRAVGAIRTRWAFATIGATARAAITAAALWTRAVRTWVGCTLALTTTFSIRWACVTRAVDTVADVVVDFWRAHCFGRHDVAVNVAEFIYAESDLFLLVAIACRNFVRRQNGARAHE